MKIIAYTQGKEHPCARFRVRQYLPYLKDANIDVTEKYTKFSAYPPRNKLLRPLWGIETIAERMIDVPKSKNYDLTWLQKTFISKYPTIEKYTKGPKLFDIDDAIYMGNPKLLTTMAQISDGVICGNEFLAEKYGEFNKNIHIIPTGVDSDRFIPREKRNSELFIIGWSGSSVGLRYVYQHEKAIASFLEKHKNTRIRIVTDTAPKFTMINPKQVEFVKWTAENEVYDIQNFDVGIMPLFDTEFEKGKCSYKMLLYMACGVPVIVSPVGMNNQVLKLGSMGASANTSDEWFDQLETMYQYSDSQRKEIGRNGRNVVINNFDSKVIAKELATVFEQYK